MAPSEFRSVFKNGKTRMMGLPYAEKRMMIVSRVDTITERDRQTDRRMDDIAISISRSSIVVLTRGKNSAQLF